MRNAPYKKFGGTQLATLAILLFSVTSDGYTQTHRQAAYDFRSGNTIYGSLENYNGQYLLSLVNNTDRELRGHIRLSIGTDSKQTDVGQITVMIAANDTQLYLLQGFSASGQFYNLRLYREDKTLAFFKIAAVRSVNAVVPAKVETVSISGANNIVSPVSPEVFPVTLPPVSQPVSEEIQVKIRVAAGAEPDDPHKIAFELNGQRSLFDATLQMIFGEADVTKPVSINRQAIVEFNLPTEIGDGKITYVLTRKDGSVAARGETNLEKLFVEEVVTVSDIRTDKTSYAPGETARLTVVMEGNAKEGFRLEITAHDTQDKQFFSTAFHGKEGEPPGEQALQISIPNDGKERVIVKFKLYDASNNSLFDSGERELTIHEKR